MIDVAAQNNIQIDIPLLAKELGVPVVPVNARAGKGLNELKKALADNHEKITHEFIDIKSISPETIEAVKDATNATSNYAALQIAHHYMNVFCLDASQKLKVKSIREQYQFNAAKSQAAEIIQRYERINRIMQLCFKQEHVVSRSIFTTTKIDKVLTHLFGVTDISGNFLFDFPGNFFVAQYPMDAIDYIFGWSSNYLHHKLPQNVLTNLLIEGVLSGIGGVVIFIPQIMILFGFITVLEDTGYMSRVSYLMDRMMRKVGLSGKSTMPLVSGLACAVPAIMSTRSIDNWKDRFITIMVTPLMSCSARLPVYILLVGFAVPDVKYLAFLICRD